MGREITGKRFRELRGKKRRHELFAVRAGRPVTQLTSGTRTVALPPRQPEYIHHSIDSEECKYKNRNYPKRRPPRPLTAKRHLRFRHYGQANPYRALEREHAKSFRF